MSTQQDVTRVKEEHKETLLAMPNVVGVGVGFKVEGRTKTSELSVVALVRQKIPNPRAAENKRQAGLLYQSCVAAGGKL